MRKISKDFNIKRFLTIVIPFGLVAMLMVITKPKTKTPLNKNTYPLYNLHLDSKEAAGSIILNDISIAHHKSNKNQKQSMIALTPWLQNGKNKLYVSTSQVNSKIQPYLKASLEIIQPNKQPEIKTLFELTKPSARGIVIEANDLPKWSWHGAQDTFHDSREIKIAVAVLHKAFANKDVKTIRKFEAPMFNDMVKITEREGLERRHYRDEIIQKGQIDPLGKLTIVPFANGKIMRVTGSDGEAPIRIFFRYGNGGKVILTGKFWSKINGQWFVVR